MKGDIKVGLFTVRESTVFMEATHAPSMHYVNFIVKFAMPRRIISHFSDISLMVSIMFLSDDG